MMLSDKERKFLQNGIEPNEKDRATLEARIKKKAETGIVDLANICKNIEKISPKTDNNSWRNIEDFCNILQNKYSQK
jgi:hypothetical protein